MDFFGASRVSSPTQHMTSHSKDESVQSTDCAGTETRAMKQNTQQKLEYFAHRKNSTATRQSP